MKQARVCRQPGRIAAKSDVVEVTGRATFTRIEHSEAAGETLTVNGFGGNDDIPAGQDVTWPIKW
jgi:hypothetical protein